MSQGLVLLMLHLLTHYVIEQNSQNHTNRIHSITLRLKYEISQIKMKEMFYSQVL